MIFFMGKWLSAVHKRGDMNETVMRSPREKITICQKKRPRSRVIVSRNHNNIIIK